MGIHRRSKTKNVIAEDLQRLIEIQCQEGNWNYSAYMHGLANGLILAKATVLGEEPKFLEAPEKWLKDQQQPTVFDILTVNEIRNELGLPKVEDQKKGDEQ